MPSFGAKRIGLSEAGNPARAMLLVTRTLLFAGEGSGLFNGAQNGGGPAFQAIDKKTGKILHELKLDGVTPGTPMTYPWKGKQYIVVATTNRTGGAKLAAPLTPGNYRLRVSGGNRPAGLRDSSSPYRRH